MEVSDQLHAPAALPLGERGPVRINGHGLLKIALATYVGVRVFLEPSTCQ
jgi:hypothetical protein